VSLSFPLLAYTLTGVKLKIAALFTVRHEADAQVFCVGLPAASNHHLAGFSQIGVYLRKVSHSEPFHCNLDHSHLLRLKQVQQTSKTILDQLRIYYITPFLSIITQLIWE